MAARFLLTHVDVSDLCIGKPPLSWLPPSTTVAHAIAELECSSHRLDSAVAVWDGVAGAAVAGRVRMADVVLFLCANDGNNQATLVDLLAAAGTPPVRRVEPDASVLEAVDALLGGAQSLVVPIRDRRRPAVAEGGGSMCWLTVEDVVRFFLGSVALFSPTASRSVSDLGAVRPACSALAVTAGDDALSAVVPLLRAALATHASVAVVSGRRLEGEISSSTLCSLDASVVAATVAALSAGELVSLVDCGLAPQEAALRCRNLLGSSHDPSSPFSSSSSSSSFASSSSSEDDEEGNGKPAYTRQGGKHGSYSVRWTKGRRAAAEPIACRRGSSLVAVMAQAVAHRVTHVWVLDDNEEQQLVGVVGFLDVLRVLRHSLLHTPPAPI